MKRLLRALFAALLVMSVAMAFSPAPASATHVNQCNDGTGNGSPTEINEELELIHLENVTIAGQPLGDLYLALDVTVDPPTVVGFWVCTETPLFGVTNVGVGVWDRSPTMIQYTVEVCVSSGVCGEVLFPTGVGVSPPTVTIGPGGVITIDPTTLHVCVYINGAATCIV